jgi:uncharacterized UBP type Zn finger protein
MGDTWVHLRECLTCGHIGCCDSSKNKHATKHFHATEHPLVQSFQPGEDWIWCYVDQVVMELYARGRHAVDDRSGQPQGGREP